MSDDINEITRPFGGDIAYYLETTYGTLAIATDATYLVSNKVLNARLDSGDVHKTLRGINRASVCSFIETGGDNVLHLEWVFQPHDASLATYCVNRTNGDIASLTFVLATNKDVTSHASYFTLKGCKAKNWNLSSSKGEEYVCTADFSVKEVDVSNTKPTNYGQPSDLNYGTHKLAGFNQAGTITFTGGYNAYITNSINITVNNNLQDYWQVGSTDKRAAIPGALDVTGSADLSLDAGGGEPWTNIVDSFTDITSLVIDTACPGGTDTTCGKITLSDGKYDSISIPVGLENGTMMSSLPFTFKTIAFATST